MALSRKHFISMAEVLAKISDDNERNRMIKVQEDFFSKENPKFDIGRFESKIFELRRKKK